MSVHITLLAANLVLVAAAITACKEKAWKTSIAVSAVSWLISAAQLMLLQVLE